MVNIDVELSHLSSAIYRVDAARTSDVTPPSADDDRVKVERTSADNNTELTPIIWYHLTFDTPLPSPSEPIRPSEPPPPECPNLKGCSDPQTWSPKHKSIVLWISCFATAMTTYTAGAYTPGVDQMSEEWHVSRVACLVGITIFTCGFAVAPMVLAPFSEMNGRRPVFLVTGILFAVGQLCCAVTRLYGGMLVARFFAGVGGSTFSTMVGGVVSDIYSAADRNAPMAMFSGAVLLGTGLGPLTSGWIAQYTTWRWIFYAQAIVDGILMIGMCIYFRETRANIVLRKKAKILNSWYEEREKVGYYTFNMPCQSVLPSHGRPSETEPAGEFHAQRIRWTVQSDEGRADLASMLRISLLRPFELLVKEPVVFAFSLWVSFSWAVLYLTLGAIPLVFQTRYNMSLGESNSIFAVMVIFAILATLLCIFQEDWARGSGKIGDTPEGRLYFSCIESALMPIGLFVFGWTSTTHWIVPTIGIVLATVGIFSIYVASFNYLADVYHRYASSALAAMSFCRNIMGGAFPLITTQMYEKLTYGGASSLLGGIGVVLTLVPWILTFYGERFRRKSKFASEILKD